jgi:hypothetical protein
MQIHGSSLARAPINATLQLGDEIETPLQNKKAALIAQNGLV